MRASRQARPDGKSPERVFYECARCDGWHLSSRLPEPSTEGPQPRQSGETWEEYAHRLERRIKQQREHITRILDLREEGNIYARKKIEGLVAALGRMTERWEHEREQKQGLADVLKAREEGHVGSALDLLAEVPMESGLEIGELIEERRGALSRAANSQEDPVA